MLSYACTFTYINLVKVNGRTTKMVSISFFARWFSSISFSLFRIFIFWAAARNLVSLLIFSHTFSQQNFYLLDTHSLFMYERYERILFYAQWLPWRTLCVSMCVSISLFSSTVVNLNGKHRTIHTHTANGCVRASNFDTFNKNSIAAKSAVSSLAHTHTVCAWFVCLNELSSRKSVAKSKRQNQNDTMYVMFTVRRSYCT